MTKTLKIMKCELSDNDINNKINEVIQINESI